VDPGGGGKREATGGGRQGGKGKTDGLPTQPVARELEWVKIKKKEQKKTRGVGKEGLLCFLFEARPDFGVTGGGGMVGATKAEKNKTLGGNEQLFTLGGMSDFADTGVGHAVQGAPPVLQEKGWERGGGSEVRAGNCKGGHRRGGRRGKRCFPGGRGFGRWPPG